MNASRAKLGYTLIELLAYLSLFAVAINMAGALFVSATRLHMLGDDAIARMQAVDEIAAAFTDAVHESLGIVESADGYVTSSDTLVLQLPDARVAVLGRLRGDDRFVMLKFRSGQRGTPTFLETCSYPLTSLAFDQVAGAIRMRVQMRHNTRRESGEHTVLATPRSYVMEVP
jgi:type II secretory pathway component PulJ